jgi:hypothetical protein
MRYSSRTFHSTPSGSSPGSLSFRTIPPVNLRFRSIRPLRWLAAAVVFGAAACADQPTAVPDFQAPRSPSRPSTVATITCSASIQARSVECAAPSNGDLTVFGGQNVHVKLTSSNVSAANGMFEFDVTVQNLLNEAIGTPDGVTPDPAGTMVFFMADPATVGGNGLVSVDNEDGTSAFTAGNQVYFTYPGILSSNQVSEAKRWRLAYGPGVTNFSFTLKVASEVQPLLVINEVMVNPLNRTPPIPALTPTANGSRCTTRGTFPVQMEGMLIADSAASGRGRTTASPRR